MTYFELLKKLKDQGKNVKCSAGNNLLFEGQKSNKKRNGFLKMACPDDMVDDVITGKSTVILLTVFIDDVNELLVEGEVI